MTDCITWDKCLSGGYGKAWRNGRLAWAHRLAWEDAHGQIPEGLILHHECHNRACVNVDHLSLMTQSEHVKGHGLQGFAAENAAKTSCPKGHPYILDPYVSWDRRICPECRKDYKREYMRARRKSSLVAPTILP